MEIARKGRTKTENRKRGEGDLEGEAQRWKKGARKETE